MNRSHRLKAPSEFALVYRTGVRASATAVTAIAAQSDSPDPRLGITCSRRIGGAVVRNRVKRRLRAAAAPAVTDLRPGVRAILQAAKGARVIDFQKLEIQVRDTLARAGAIEVAGEIREGRPTHG